MSRTHTVKVTLSDRELVRLDELRENAARAVYLRRFLYEPPSAAEVASHEEVLGLLSRQARGGSISAAIALERALRAIPNSDEDWDDELSRIIVDD
jgi:hypothetical protein